VILTHAAMRSRTTGLKHHPMKGVIAAPAAPREKDPIPQPPTGVELVRFHIAQFENVMSGDSNQLFVSFGAQAGLRPGETRALDYLHALGMENDGLEWDALAETPHSYIRYAIGADSRRKETKNLKRRYVPLPEMLRDEVRAHMRRHRRQLTDRIFPELEKHHAYRNFSGRSFDAARAAAAADPLAVQMNLRTLGEVTPYDLGRHSYASLRLRAGMWQDQATLARWLGHSISMLLRHYAGQLAAYSGTKPVDFESEWKAARDMLEERRRSARHLRAVNE
jgi:hypothetical protein